MRAKSPLARDICGERFKKAEPAEKEEGLSIKIFNVTSLTSGDLFKNPGNDSNWPKSYVRDPNKTTPYGNISQTYNLLIRNK